MSTLDPGILEDIKTLSRLPAVTNILEVICRTTGMGFAAVARVTENKWVACVVRDEIQFGLEPGGELQLETTICNEIRQDHRLVVIDHVAKDEHFSKHHTPAMYGFQSYISVPIILKDGSFFGTLCSIDPNPAALNNQKIIGMFTLFAELIAFHLNAVEKLELAEAKLEEEMQTAELREQFIAILGHDLRNPVGAVSNGAQMLRRMPLESKALKLAGIIEDASYRMIKLIDNVLDFARGRMGSGIGLNLKQDQDIGQTLEQVITEMRMLKPDRVIQTAFSLDHPVNCDAARIAQLFSNLLSNALSYGKADAPVLISAQSNKDKFSLAVVNSGSKIPEASMERLFQPFSRGEVEPDKQGLGLGLYISAEIARAHGGSLSVSSDDRQTSFVLEFPSAC
ncbi:MAG TPA: GAF domain-containing sensor histidine kinase [Pedobacter sp.]|nr:GAF domain-containing sensor histidine kinase [Pedobacter sp.]